MSPPLMEKALADFAPITLEDMERVKLMDRTDTKFIVSSSQVPELLRRVRQEYQVLEVAGTRVSRYETLYYDTAELGLYRRHHAGKADRWKVRARRYVESGVCFFEVKHKNNKGRTIKRRISTPSIEESLTETAASLLAELTELDPASLKGRLWVNYGRITLVSKTTPERLTIDVGLNYRTADRSIDVGQVAIIEVKRANANAPSPVIDALREMRIKPGSMSKYCLGIVMSDFATKVNNFKQKLRLLQRISHAA